MLFLGTLLAWFIGTALGLSAWEMPTGSMPKGSRPTGSMPQREAALPLDEPVRYNRDIRPILSDKCFACHGPDASHRQGDLRLDLRQHAIDAGAIQPGSLTESGLWDRISSEDESLRMPPLASHKSLSPVEQRLIGQWIEEGALYEEHWSFVPPIRCDIPSQGHPIDQIMDERFSAQNLTWSPPADPRTLIRRLYFDLIGLPPTWEEVKRFQDDPSDIVYEALVDRLLANPHYGERMAIGWLDVVRFADTIGIHSDNPRNIWPYRDWVIQAFNANMPFDRFTLHQLAGDLIPQADQASKVGSAFNRLVQSTEEGGAQPKDYEARMLADRVRAVGTVWLGLTTGCAQCHDHKFDPITSRDFYSLGAFFADIEEQAIGAREPGMLVLSPQEAARLQSLDDAIAKAQRILEQNAKSPTEAMMTATEKTRQDRKAYLNSLPKCLVSQSAKVRRVVRILPRGNWQDESGPEVQPAFPEFLTRQPASAAKSRIDLAYWLVAPEQPLTARVQVNRLWRQFFGEGLCRSMNDLGLQGDFPNQQALLDWLACELQEQKWDIKHLVKLIVTSRAYRQSSQGTAELLDRDPLNREFARQNAFRLDAELIRDQALQVSRLLDATLGGPSVKPYQPEGYWENLNFPARRYEADRGRQQHRRGLYVWWQRTFLHPSLLAFDAPSREECAAERNRSNIPQQALVLLNDPSYLEAYQALAHRLLDGDAQATPLARIRSAFESILQRPPSDEETNLLLTTYQTHRERYAAQPELAQAWLQHPPLVPAVQVDRVELAAWMHVVRIVFNLHETIVRY